MISDQIDNTDDLEIDGSIEVEAEAEAEEIEEESESNDESTNEESESGEEKALAKKIGYVEFTPEQQAKFNMERRLRMDAERKQAAIQRELEQYKKVEPPKEVPPPSADPVTDPDVYAKQAREREAYIRAATKYESDAEKREQQSAESEQKRQGALLDTYNKNIERLKVNRDILAKAANAFTEYEISKELVEELLEDDDGPAIVAYLGGNKDELADIALMSTAKAVKYIERQIRSKIHSKQTSKAPPPPTRVNGSRPKSGVVENGVTFE